MPIRFDDDFVDSEVALAIVGSRENMSDCRWHTSSSILVSLSPCRGRPSSMAVVERQTDLSVHSESPVQ